MVDERILNIWNKLGPLQKTGGAIILLTFSIAGKNKLRRKELAEGLGVKLSKEKGGIISDKTLDTRLTELMGRNILDVETDYEDYPPGKYYKLTEKGEEALVKLLQLVDKL